MREEIERARMLLAGGDLDAALAQAKRLYARRRQSAEVVLLLKEVYEALGDAENAAFYTFLSVQLAPADVSLQRTLAERLGAAGLARARTMACLPINLAPFYDRLDSLTDGAESVFDLFLGCNIVCKPGDTENYWVGLYNPNAVSDAKAMFVEMVRANHPDTVYAYDDVTFDLLCAEEVREASMEITDAPCIVPLIGTEKRQHIIVRETDGEAHVAVLAKHEPYFLRLSQTTHFSLPQDAGEGRGFAIGRPIPLGHSPKRKKLVLNILADGLSWAQQKRENYHNIPNIMRFFSKGTIFQHAFSQSEYTFPSLATIETGMNVNHSQLFHPERYAALDPACITISEQMSRLGYYSVVVQGDGEGIYNGATRGYARQLINHYTHSAAVGVSRVIAQLEAFGETDQFLFLHVDEPHPNNGDVRFTEVTQAKMPLGELLKPSEAVTSVFLEHSARNIHENRSKIAAMDRALGMLFDYIETHYEEDDFLVHLYSDHGCSIYSAEPWILSEDHGNIALMMRGGGVPHAGFVDELISTADIYKIVGHNAGYPIDGAWLDGNLPEVLGGKRREYTMSWSIYPGQTHKMCLRTETHEFRLETEASTREDGSARLEPFKAALFTRPDHERVDDENVMAYFLEKILTDPCCMLMW